MSYCPNNTFNYLLIEKEKIGKYTNVDHYIEISGTTESNTACHLYVAVLKNAQKVYTDEKIIEEVVSLNRIQPGYLYIID